MRKKIIKLLALCLMSVFVIAAAAVPAAASDEFSEEKLDSLLQNTEDFVDTVMSMTDDELAMLESYGDFYAIAEQAILEGRDELGEYFGVLSGTVSQEDEIITMSIMADFETYDAEIVVLYNVEENGPVNFTINPQYPLSVNLANAGRNTIIGIAIVFVILAVLSLIISCFKFINPDARKAKNKAEQKTTESAEKKVAEIPVQKAAPAASDDEEIIAVIAAAIAAASADGADSSSYTVHSIKKIGTGRRWKRS